MRQFLALFPLFKMVLTDARVIGTAIVVFLVMNFGVFVANYVKKPKKQRRRRVVAVPTPASENDDEASETDGDIALA
ncbi:MAG: hypothetical protein J6I73_02940 [Treponema sp.]|nr:hypothetical protein [Treponema sp.]